MTPSHPAHLRSMVRPRIGEWGRHARRHRRGRGRRPDAGADAACARPRLRRLRGLAADPRARRRHQRAAARHRRAGRARPAAAARRGGDPHARADLRQPLRAGDLARAARAGGRLQGAAVLHPPRPSAGRAARRGDRAAGARADPHGARFHRVRAGRGRRQGALQEAPQGHAHARSPATSWSAATASIPTVRRAALSRRGRGSSGTAC